MKISRYAIFEQHNGSDYAYSGMSGAFLRLAPHESSALANLRQGDDPNPDDLTDLLRLGIVTASDQDQLNELSNRRSAGLTDETGMAITIVSSVGCNFDCPYCFESKYNSILKPDVQDFLIAHIERQLPNLQNLQIHWIGGEPLLARQVLFAFSDKVHKLLSSHPHVSYASDITTNGYLLDPATANQLVKAGVSKAQICIDGPPEVHDRMRPLASGKGTFYRVLSNVIRAAEILDITIRVNSDKVNIGQAKEVLDILKQCSLDGKIAVYLGKLTNVDDHAPTPSPSVTYVPSCFTTAEYAQQEADFLDYAAKIGFNKPAFPQPMALPCTAVRPNEIVIGADGEIWKCWENIGNPRSSLGNIRDAALDERRLGKWLNYTPFTNEECTQCVALPVCMGGCAHHAMSESLYEHRCVSFKYNHEQRIKSFLNEMVEPNARQNRPPVGLKLLPITPA